MNYDDWKLMSPDDEGYEMVSNCCGARMDEDQGLCYKCKDHCEPMEDYEYEAIQKEAYEEMRADERRDSDL